jgi:hypothetical protein
MSCKNIAVKYYTFYIIEILITIDIFSLFKHVMSTDKMKDGPYGGLGGESKDPLSSISEHLDYTEMTFEQLQVYKYIHIYMYTCIYIYIDIYIHTYVYIYIYIYIYLLPGLSYQCMSYFIHVYIYTYT